MEKTDLLARHATIPLFQKKWFKLMRQPLNEEITKEQLLEIMEQTIDEMKESIEKESLVLLKQELLNRL